MPRGTTHDEFGILNEAEGRFSLRRDGGGTWRLDIHPRDLRAARAMAGTRVRIAGLRSDFDLLDVSMIRPV